VPGGRNVQLLRLLAHLKHSPPRQLSTSFGAGPCFGQLTTNDAKLMSTRRALELAVAAFFFCYILYTLTLSKMFTPSVAPAWYRDLGILWDLSDAVIEEGRFVAGYYFPPPNAIIMHATGQIDRGVAFRLFLGMQGVCLLFSLWAWSKWVGVLVRPERALIIFSAFAAAGYYVHFDLHMHNLNLITFALVSASLVFAARNAVSAACFGLAVALKPHGSILILPWMAWIGHWRWTIVATASLVAFMGVLPALYLGLERTVTFYRDWTASLLTMLNADQSLSLRGGIAQVLHAQPDSPLVSGVNWLLIALYAAAAFVFFQPLIRSRAVDKELAPVYAAALLLLPFPLGANHQSPRGVVLLAATLIMAATVFDPAKRALDRAIIAGLLMGIGVSTYTIAVGPLQALLSLPICLACLLGLAVVRRASSPT
jgi:hypothetical protein